MKRSSKYLFIITLSLAEVIIFSCGQRKAKKVGLAAVDEKVDTLSTFPALPDAPLITFFETTQWNPSSTGWTSEWEERVKNCYADSLQKVLKTMLVEMAFEVSETAMAMRNDIYPDIAPALLLAKGPLRKDKEYNFWSEYNDDTISELATFEPQLTSLFDCRFGPFCKRQIIKSSYPIEIMDTLSYRPIIKIKDVGNGKVYSPLFECFFRRRSILICSFDIDSLKNTDAGRYFWDVIRNYTYAESFREDVRNHVKEMERQIWYDTMLPGYRD